MPPEFEWDATKARESFKKHGVAFDEALTVFADPLTASGCQLHEAWVPVFKCPSGWRLEGQLQWDYHEWLASGLKSPV
jgi:hypothetical protein